jgi:hypothetical protein
MRVVESVIIVNLGVRCQSPCHAPSVRSAVVLLCMLYSIMVSFTLSLWLHCAPYASGRISLQLLVVCL